MNNKVNAFSKGTAGVACRKGICNLRHELEMRGVSLGANANTVEK